MNDLKEIKQVIASCGLYSPFVREIVKTWASGNKSTPHNWLQLVSAVLKDCSVALKALFEKILHHLGNNYKDVIP